MRAAAAAVAPFLLAFAGSAAAQTDIAAADLCAGRTPCEVVARMPAGRDGVGRALQVVELGLGPTDPESGARCRPRLREFWTVIDGGAGKHRMLRLCNDGYGASGVGEDNVRIFRNRLIHGQYGGSAWRWHATVRYRLVPAARVREEHCSYHTFIPGFVITRWNWRRFAGETLIRFRADVESGNGEAIGCDPDDATHRFSLIPHIDGVDGLAADAAPVLGDCAAAVREDGTEGYVVHGAPAASGGAEMRLLLVGERDLLVTVLDAGFDAGNESWVHDDHVEIWQAGIMSSDNDFLESRPLRQWGVRLTDDAVFAGAGDPQSMPVVIARRADRVETGMVAAVRLRLVEKPQSLSVVYSNGENGRQHRLSANSPIRFGDAATLGDSFDVSRHARCAVSGGRVVLTASGIPGEGGME